MKTICVILAITLFADDALFGKIRNGYTLEISSVSASLRALTKMLAEESTLTHAQRRVMEKRIKELSEYILYYELTAQMLSQFKIIAPGLYNTIDSLRDTKGRPTDVYIRFIPESRARVQAWGVTNIATMNEDPDGYRSEFGDHTVSIKVWTVNRSLLVLAHEMGHVKYQVDHLASYFEYYKDTYPPHTSDPNNIGHALGDPSGGSAIDFERVFKENFFRYWKKAGIVETPTDLKDRITRQIRMSQSAEVTSL